MTTKLFIHLIIVIALISCRSQPAEENNSEANDALPPATEATITDTTSSIIYIENKFDYTSVFLESLEATGLSNIQLVGNRIIVDDQDEYLFPSHLKVFRMNAFFGQEGDLNIKLKAERINQSTITYELLAGEHHDLKLIVGGGAHLAGDFFLREIIEVNELTDNIFPVAEYIDEDKDCRTTIHIGKEENSKLMARISKICNGNPVSLATEKPILLIEK